MSLLNKITVFLVLIISTLSLQQCDEENVPIVITSKSIPLEITFLNESEITQENDTLLISFQLSRTAPEAAQINVAINHASIVHQNDFTTSPITINNEIVVPVNKGDSIVGFHLYTGVDSNQQTDSIGFNIVNIGSASDIFKLGNEVSNEVFVEEKITSVQFENSSVTMLENEIATIKITLSYPAIEQSNILVKATSDIAIYGVDYNTTPQLSSSNTLELLIDKGQSKVTFQVESLVDNDEAIENVIFDIVSITGYNLVFGENSQFTLSISDTYNNQCDFTGIDANYTSCLSELSESTLDVVTWNLENFPTNGSTTLSMLEDIIPNINADIIAIQEVKNISDFNNLTNNLDNWESIAIDVPYALDFGYLYKPCEIEVLEAPSIALSSTLEPRPAGKIKIKHLNTGLEVTLFNIHLKCCGVTGSDEANRREAASIALQTHINNNMPNEKVIVLGDWNDDIYDGPFDNFLNDDNFAFADEEIANGSSSNWSYPGWPSHLDHILITDELFDHLTEVSTIKLEGCVSNVENNVSDHRAVLARFK